MRTYSELIQLETFEERFDYLRLGDRIGKETFGFDRYLNQIFYSSPEWKAIRNEVIVRDNGCDMALEGYEIYDHILIHHMNPISVEDIRDRNDDILNIDYLVCVSHNTHNAIHYGNDIFKALQYKERKPNDTCPWKQ